MKYLLTIILVVLLAACNQNKDDKGVNFVVTDKKDTLSYFYYEGHEKYKFYDSTESSNLFSDKNLLSKIPGHFHFGIADRTGKSNKFLIFRQITKSQLELQKVQQVPPFFKEEFLPNRKFKVELSKNYTDSINNEWHKFETYLAIDNTTSDTILYQETEYVITKNTLLTTLIVYDDLDTREEMRLVLVSALATIKESIRNK